MTAPPFVPAIAAYETQMRDWGYAAVRESGENAQRAIASNPVARRVGCAYFRTRRMLRNLSRRTEPTDRLGQRGTTVIGQRIPGARASRASAVSRAQSRNSASAT